MKILMKFLFIVVMGSSYTMAKKVSSKDSFANPTGWRVPNKSELKDEWRIANSNRFATVKGDFNGDKKTDEAKYLVSEDGKRFGIFVWFAGETSKNPVEVFTELNISAIHYMGIDLYKTGNYKTACGKGYFECKDGETPEIKLSNDAINYFKDESANSMFYWNGQKKLFIRTWMND